MFNPLKALSSSKRILGPHGGVNTPIYPSSTFTTNSPSQMEALFNGEAENPGFLYGRHFHPNAVQYGTRLAAMEAVEMAYPTASGMAAISVTINQLTSPGDHIVSSSNIYGGSFALFKDLYADRLVNVDFIPPNRPDMLLEKINDKTKVVYLEMFANPTLQVAHLQEISKICKERDIKVVVDNTFTPMIITPSLHGADITVYSCTKYLNGSSDIVAGAICADSEFINSIMDLNSGKLMLNGACATPTVAWQLDMKLNDLHLRMNAHSKRALILASEVEKLGKFQVFYPGLISHADHNEALKYINIGYGFSGILAIDLETKANSEKFVISLIEKGLAHNAVSLGYFDTLVSVSSSSTSSEVDPETLKANKISDGLVRISVGYTGYFDDQLSGILESLKSI